MDDTHLVRGLREKLAHSAPGTVQPCARRGRFPRRACPGGGERAPARLKQIVIRSADGQARATDGGHEWAGCRPVSRPVAHDQRFVAVVT